VPVKLDQLLSVFGEENLMDMSEGGPARSDGAAREGLRKHSAELFAEFSVTLAVIVGESGVLDNTAYD